MGKVIVMNHLTLDGVMQGPGRADEDTRDGFERGGWAVPRTDETIVTKMGERMGGDRAFLFGRRTYEDLLASWNAQGGPFKDALNNARKYVASGNPAARIQWPNSTLLHGDVPAAVADLKQRSGTNLVIMGSGVLIGSLMAANLIDEYLLMTHPLVLGIGRRLFPEGVQVTLRLADGVITSTGVVIASYELPRRAEG
jgi:dihydrofolate reductase